MDAIPEIQKTHAGAKDHFAVYDMQGFCEDADTLSQKASSSWYGNQDTGTAIKYAREGDLSQVAPSQALLDQFESLVFVSRKFRVIDDIVGAVPNVPAFIAGQPMSMRRRVRQTSASAPLALFIDLTTSGGICANDVRKRGIAILALVRLLSNLRPIEIYVMTGLGGYQTAEYCIVRLDTSPLDLARAAHMLTSVAVARDLCYRLCNKVGASSRSAWPYGYDVELQRKHGQEIMRRVVQPGSEILFMPPMYLTDEAVQAPVQWIKKMLAQYGGQTVEQ
jgi:hypothetical protein